MDLRPLLQVTTASHTTHFKPGAKGRVTGSPNRREPNETGAFLNDSPGISGRHLSDTPNFIRGLHGRYPSSWGQKSDLKVETAIFGKELTQIEDD
jgi:hypothetical protein